MAGRGHSVIPTHPSRRSSRAPHPFNTAAHRQESTYHLDTLGSTRQDYDSVLQVPDRQCPSLLLRRYRRRPNSPHEYQERPVKRGDITDYG